MEFIDTHSHLYDEAFISEEDLAVARAVEAGVTQMILPDIDSASRDAMFCLAEGLIRVNLDTGTIYGIRGPGGISMKEWRELKGTLQNAASLFD